MVEGKQPPYKPIYSLGLVKLETLKIYTKIYLKTRFIWSFKSPTSISIFFDLKPDRSLYLYINYQGLNHLTIKNWYPLLLIDKALKKLGWAKYFTQLDLTSAYYKMRIWESDK